MRVLIVHAHPDNKSFNAALTQSAIEQLTADGHDVQLSDLYAMKFKAVLDEDDFEQRNNVEQFHVAHEQTYAVEVGAQAADVTAEQEKVMWADLIIFQFPLWWFGMPAILKGWVDRVWARGFAYYTGRKYDTGMLRGKLGLICVTTGTSADTYAPDGIDGSLFDTLWPINNGVFRYTGCDVVEPYFVFMPAKMSDSEREEALSGWRAKLHNIDNEPRLQFHADTDYGDNDRLKPGVIAKSGFQHNA